MTSQIFAFLFAFAFLFVVVTAVRSKAHNLDQGRYVITPGGREVWSTCLHEVPSGSVVEVSEDESTTSVLLPGGARMEVPPCPMPTRRVNLNRPNKPKPTEDAPDSGWQVWTTYQHPQNKTFTSFLGSFTVPSTPVGVKNFNAILYMFTGVQSDNWVPIAGEPSAPPTFDIIQPVIQYGSGSSNGGGNFWGLASWYVTLNNGALFSKLMKIPAGASVFGNMTMTSSDTWFIGGVVNGASTNLTVTRPRLESQPWAYTTLETYNIPDCSWFPPSGSTSKFTGMALEDENGPVSPQWISNENQAHCSVAIDIDNPATLTFNF